MGSVISNFSLTYSDNYSEQKEVGRGYGEALSKLITGDSKDQNSLLPSITNYSFERPWWTSAPLACCRNGGPNSRTSKLRALLNSKNELGRKPSKQVTLIRKHSFTLEEGGVKYNVIFLMSNWAMWTQEEPLKLKVAPVKILWKRMLIHNENRL